MNGGLSLVPENKSLRDQICVLENMIRMAIKNAKPEKRSQARWVLVRDLFGIGSTSAIEICYRLGLDPHEEVRR